MCRLCLHCCCQACRSKPSRFCLTSVSVLRTVLPIGTAGGTGHSGVCTVASWLPHTSNLISSTGRRRQRASGSRGSGGGGG
jgi:hypothetical protein